MVAMNGSILCQLSFFFFTISTNQTSPYKVKGVQDKTYVNSKELSRRQYITKALIVSLSTKVVFLLKSPVCFDNHY